MRALPADSLEYFGEIAVGNTAFPVALGAVPGVAAGAPAAGAAAVASGPHWALRKSRQFCPPSVPADLAAWYLALHSFIVSACAGCPEVTIIAPTSATRPAHGTICRIVMGRLLRCRGRPHPPPILSSSASLFAGGMNG